MTSDQFLLIFDFAVIILSGWALILAWKNHRLMALYHHKVMLIFAALVLSAGIAFVLLQIGGYGEAVSHVVDNILKGAVASVLVWYTYSMRAHIARIMSRARVEEGRASTEAKASYLPYRKT